MRKPLKYLWAHEMVLLYDCNSCAESEPLCPLGTLVFIWVPAYASESYRRYLGPGLAIMVKAA